MGKLTFLPKTSIFIRMFLPVIGIIMLLVVFINIFFHASGMADALNDSAIDILVKNVQIRGDSLEHMMVHYWSNIDRLEHEVVEGIRTFLSIEGITIDELLGDSTREIALLGNLSGTLIDTLRVSATTGVFMYFVSGEGFSEEVRRLNGLYYRNHSPLTTIHANIIFLRGHLDIARRDNIPRDSLWEEYFTFDPRHEDIWRGFLYPQIAAANTPDAPSVDISFWNRSHVFNPYPRVDPNWQITYNRPIILDGRVVAMIGTEMQLSHLDRHFPARDLDTFAESGYFLFRYDTRDDAENTLAADVQRISGGLMNRLLGDFPLLTIQTSDNSNIFTLSELPEIRGVYSPMRIYNPLSSFAHETWVLAAVATEYSLFEMPRRITNTIMLSSVAAVLAGGILVFFSIKTVTKPIGSLIKQINEGKGDTAITTKTNTYEVDLLMKTINDMIERRLAAERHIREEHRRYLLAEAEAAHRDMNTGFLKREHGLQQIKRIKPPFTLSHIRIKDFDRLEFTYGSIFGAIYISQFAHDLLEIVGDDGFIVRTGVDEFVVCYDLTPEEVGLRSARISRAFSRLYAGDEMGLTLDLQFAIPDSLHGLVLSKREETPKINPNDKENIVSLTLELFERTPHIGCAAKMLLGLLGRLFKLDRAVVCVYDPGFGTNQITHEWHIRGKITPYHTIRKVSVRTFKQFENMQQNDTFTFATESAPGGSMGALLCVPRGGRVSLYGCAIREQKQYTGSVLFMSDDPAKVWDEQEKAIFNNIAKIIATYTSVEKSRSASRAKSRFLSRISHEIRTPMHAILGMTKIAMDATAGNNYPRVEDCLNKINISANYLLALINDVLEMSRIESGKFIKIEARAFSLADFVQEIEAVIRFAIESRGIIFNVENEIRNDIVRGDDYRIKQVLINLLGNANKFTPAGGVITLRIEELEDGVFRFAVTDTGVGISADKHDLIFNPFEQAESGVTGNQGTGLGLAISRNLVAAMKSTIELVSEVNQGSKFSFVLTLPTAEKDIDITDIQKHDGGRVLEGARILAVDDVEVNLEIISFILECAGAQVEMANSGQEAIDAFMERPPGYYDVILMDIQMPDIDGIAAARAIRNLPGRPEAAEIPIIALTANAFDEDLKKSVASGLNHHISKPIDSDALLDVLKSYIKEKG